MKQTLLHAARVVRDCDEAIEFFCGKLRFELVDDTYQPDKRWVVVAPPGSTGASNLLARASTPEQEASSGVRFVREPKRADYGTVAVFEDLYGNLWDLIERNE